MNPGKTALIAGASGLTGGHLLKFLLRSSRYGRVVSLGRRKIEMIHPKLEQVVADLEEWQHRPDIFKADDVFCCLGTTIKKAGSKGAFRKVDYGMVTELSELSSAQGAKQFLLVSAMGADASSRIFYNKIKGKAEQQVQTVSFQSVHIMRPSLLLGDRKEERKGERLASLVMTKLKFLFKGPLKKYAAIKAEDVARAMVMLASEEKNGIFIHPSDKIAETAAAYAEA